MTFVLIVILVCLVHIQLTACLYCVRHQSTQGGYNAVDSCKLGKNRPISAASFSNKLDAETQQPSLTFDLQCTASASECESVTATLDKATDIISSAFQFEMPLTINASYFSFCQKYQECHLDSKYASIGQAYPSISYVMIDNTDQMTRLYPQSLLKQYTNITEKPAWTPFDIEAQFNSEINWYFFNNPNPIKGDQTDFLRNVIHELIHGLGFISSWSDDFYQNLLPLFTNGELDHFITPTLLAEANDDELMLNYNSNQPFWGFVEFPFDKFIYYVNNNDNSKYTPLSTTTRLLNNFSGSNTTFQTVVDLANAWHNSDEYKYSKRLYTKAVAPLDVVTIVDSQPLFYLESSVTPFSSGSSLCHVDQSLYSNSSEYLMVYLADAGVDINQLDALFPEGPIGPKLLKIMATLGYRLYNNQNVSTIRPSLSYWAPPQGLVGTGSNLSPSLSVNTDGPARMPTSSASNAASSFTNQTESKTSSALTITRQYWTLILFCIIITTTTTTTTITNSNTIYI